MKTVAVILPTYNEKENLADFVSQVLSQQKYLPGWDIEVVIADSHSPDGTGEIAKRLAAKNKHIHFLEVGRGLGVGLIEGHRYAIKNLKPDVLAQMDADGQVEVDILPRMVKEIEKGYDYVQGSRYVKGGKNNLSLSRQIFSLGMSWVSRIVMGPFNLREFANSARAFTPQIFAKVNLDRLPWQDQTFIIQPAFTHEIIQAGAKYSEIPLVFKNRAEGYSKNKTFNYTYDVLSYVVDARLNSWGIRIPFFRWARKSRVLFMFSVVGLSGTVVDYLFYRFFIYQFGLLPGAAKAFSTEFGIINNFLFNNFWTFKDRKTTTNVWQRFGIYNLVSLGGLIIAVFVIIVLHGLYGDGNAIILGKKIGLNTLYFLATIPPVMIWNFTVNHFITWRHKKT